MDRKTAAPLPNYTPNWLDRLDGRTALAQELRNRYTSMTADLGGEAGLSYMQRSLVNRALHLEYFLELEEHNLREGGTEAFDAGKWTQAVNSLQGVLSKLGLQRQSRDVTLNDFMQGRRQ